jgi:two-component system, cell cycle sensor histidine kinase and response regulator CckA
LSSDPELVEGLLLPLTKSPAMATISNVRLQKTSRAELALAGVPLEALPLAAAILGSSGETIGSNTAWRELHGQQGDAPALDWCPPALRAEILAAVGQVLTDPAIRVTRDYPAGGSTRRISIAGCTSGVLLCDQPLDGAGAQKDRRGQEAEKMETVGRLVGGVAHDFANLLTLIAGYSDLLLKRVSDKDPLRPELDEIRSAANRGARLTSQLLGFTRGQAVERRALDLNLIVTDLERMLRLIAGERVAFETQLSPGLRPVVADAGQMEQVIMNLILNARDAMPSGGTIRIVTANVELDAKTACHHELNPGPAVMLSISDTGHGIDSEALQHIFEPFFTTKEKGKGTGLGLTTVHRIVRESGGNIWVESAPGEGATFRVCLPGTPRAADRRETPASLRPAKGGSETLLLVEDEDNVRRLLVHILGRCGYKVLEACDGVEALRIFETPGTHVDLVITDMVMPRMTGRELGERLKTAHPGTRVIYMSGYTDDVLVRSGALGPGMSFLQKPLRPEVLTSKVRETLDAKLD